MDDYTYDVAQLSREIGDAIAWRFPEQVWVRGEIRNMNRARSGHVYFSLVDPADESDAKIPVTLFLPDKEEVNRVMVAAGGQIRMDDGIEIRIRGSIQHYPGQGTVQMRMTSIDPAFTVGQLEIQRARTLATLRAERLLDANAAIRLPLVPLRIGLLTSRGSAAEADVRETLDGSAHAFDVTPMDVRVQGPEAAPSIVRALARAQERDFDVVLLTRGGGAATDLAVFDDESVARAIAGSVHPVLTGIGHQTDQSIADVVAHRSFKTPTACAGFVVSRIDEFLDRLDAAEQRAVFGSRWRLDQAHRQVGPLAERTARSVDRTLGFARRRVDTAGSVLGRVAGLQLASAAAGLDRSAAHLQLRAGAATERSDELVEFLHRRLSGVHPDHTLRRGWSIARSDDGTALRSIGDVAQGDRVTIELADGTLDTTVTSVTPKDRTDP